MSRIILKNDYESNQDVTRKGGNKSQKLKSGGPINDPTQTPRSRQKTDSKRGEIQTGQSRPAAAEERTHAGGS
jgi:hypothetical protein